MRYLLLLMSFNLFGFKLGIEQLSPKQLAYLRTKKVGLVVNQTSVRQDGTHTAEYLQKKGIQISYIITPEHGIEERMFLNKGHYKKLREIPERKLFHHDGLVPLKDSTLANIDVIMFDLQDVGMRYFTHGASLYYLLQAAQKHDIELWVLDRPNPMGGVIEGLCPDSAASRFVYGAVPLRHGLTMGELADYLNNYFLEKKTKLTVVSMDHYVRQPYDGALRIPLCPGLRSKQGGLCYALTGFLGEIRPFATGLRSDYAYCFIGLHVKRNISDEVWKPVQQLCKTYGVHSTIATYEDRKTKHNWHGLHISIPNPQQCSITPLYIKLLTYFKKQGVDLSYSDLFKSLCANKVFLDYMNDAVSYTTLVEKINLDLKKYYERATIVFRYHPYPKVEFLK